MGLCQRFAPNRGTSYEAWQKVHLGSSCKAVLAFFQQRRLGPPHDT